jgi:glyoxylase-like metal-dependent hydrolase (beta-lactamase superfamily II)
MTQPKGLPIDVVRFRLGDFPCVVLCDGSETLTETDVTSMFTKDAERMLAAFRALHAPLGFSRNILLVETAAKRVLIDTGNGQVDPADPGHLLDNLRTANITRESIDTVVISHYHRDHIGGLLDSAGHPTFVNARLVVPKLEHDHWMREDVLAGMAQETATRLRQTFAAYASGLTLLESTAEIEPGIRYVPALGHSPGHQAVSIESQGARLLHLVDTLHMPIQLNAVDVPAFDFQPDIAIDSRRAMLAQTESENLLVLAYHFPFPGLGHVKRTGVLPAWEPYIIPTHSTTKR